MPGVTPKKAIEFPWTCTYLPGLHHVSPHYLPTLNLDRVQVLCTVAQRSIKKLTQGTTANNRTWT